MYAGWTSLSMFMNMTWLVMSITWSIDAKQNQITSQLYIFFKTTITLIGGKTISDQIPPSKRYGIQNWVDRLFQLLEVTTLLLYVGFWGTHASEMYSYKVNYYSPHRSWIDRLHQGTAKIVSRFYNHTNHNHSIPLHEHQYSFQIQ